MKENKKIKTEINEINYTREDNFKCLLLKAFKRLKWYRPWKNNKDKDTKYHHFDSVLN